MKLLNPKFSLFALVGALTLASCEDVPAPYEINTDTTPSDVLLSETFSTSLGDFQTVQSVGDYAWVNSYSCAQVTAYVNSTNNNAESWLITPAIDAVGVDAAYVSFDYILRYALASTMKENHQVLVSTNFTGIASDVNNATWTPLSFSPVSGSDWNTWYSSGRLAIPEEYLNTSNLRIALRYKATSEKAGTWEVKNFIVSKGTGDSETPDEPLDDDTYISETFATSFGVFTPFTVKGTPWAIDYSAATATGYDNSTKVTTPSDAYLVSPAIDLSGTEAAHVSWQYILRYFTNNGQAKPGVTDEVIITNNYTGDPATTSWTVISPTMTEGSDYTTWYDADVNVPASMLKANIVVALHYTCEENSATWEVRNFVLSKGEASESGQGGQGGGETTDKGATADNPLLASEALALITSDQIPSGKVYIKGKVVSIDELSTSYGNATYYISDDGTTANQLMVYRGYYFNGDKFTSNAQLAVGDELLILGQLVNYKGNTPEVTQGSQIVTRNGSSSDGGSGETPGDDTGGDTPIVPPTGDNLVGNGDFETWADGIPTNWKTSTSAGNANLSQSSEAHGGSWSVLVEGNTGANKRLGYRETTLKAGTYYVKFYAKAATETGGSVRPGYVPVKDDGSVGSYIYGDYVNGLTTAEWVECSYSFTLTEATKLSLVIMCSKNPGGNVLIDDYSLTTGDGGLAE